MTMGLAKKARPTISFATAIYKISPSELEMRLVFRSSNTFLPPRIASTHCGRKTKILAKGSGSSEMIPGRTSAWNLFNTCDALTGFWSLATEPFRTFFFEYHASKTTSFFTDLFFDALNFPSGSPSASISSFSCGIVKLSYSSLFSSKWWYGMANLGMSRIGMLKHWYI